MKNKTYMLPNRFRKYGYVMLIAAVLSLLIGILLDIVMNAIPEFLIRYIAMASYILFFVGLFINVMSEEKDEDEMIAAIRGKAVSLTAFIAFALFIIINLVGALDHGVGFLEIMPFAFTSLVITNVFTYILIYLLIFRISLWKMRRQCKEDEA